MKQMAWLKSQPVNIQEQMVRYLAHRLPPLRCVEGSCANNLVTFLDSANTLLLTESICRLPLRMLYLPTIQSLRSRRPSSVHTPAPWRILRHRLPLSTQDYLSRGICPHQNTPNKNDPCCLNDLLNHWHCARPLLRHTFVADEAANDPLVISFMTTEARQRWIDDRLRLLQDRFLVPRPLIEVYPIQPANVLRAFVRTLPSLYG